MISWADHIQAIHSQCPIMRSTKFLGQPKKKLPKDEILEDENQCLEDEGADCSSSCMRAFVWDVNYMLYWQLHFENRIAVNCSFTQWKWTCILTFEPWKWSALNMRLVDKWPSRIQRQWFFKVGRDEQKFWVGSRKSWFVFWGCQFCIYLPPKARRGGLASAGDSWHSSKVIR
jgi:hypothetical protein